MKPQPVTIDFVVLPTDLLALTKAHVRVDHSDDDDYIKSCLSRAIANREGEWELQVNPATISWTPDSTDFCGDKAKAPVRPITSMTASATAGDVSSAYSLEKQGLFGAAGYLISGAWQDGLQFLFSSGYSAAIMPPGVLDNVLILAAHLYKHREIFTDQGTEAVPTPAIDSSTPWWVPRV